MIILERVSKRYRAGGMTVEALREFSANLEAGEFLVVTGRSGSGKSTLLSLMGGLTRPDTGRVKLDGQDLWSMTDAQRARFRARTMGFIFQFASLMPTLTVLENVLLPASFLPRGEGGDRERALSLLEQVGLGGYDRHMPWQLSGGQQKRVAVARALLNRPRLILADEPTADLDEQTELEVMRLLLQQNASGTTVVLVTHNTELTGLASRHLVLSEGRVSRAS